MEEKTAHIAMLSYHMMPRFARISYEDTVHKERRFVKSTGNHFALQHNQMLIPGATSMVKSCFLD